MFAGEADSQIRPDELAIVKLEFVAGTAVDGLALDHARAAVRQELARPLVTAIRKLDHREAFVNPAHVLLLTSRLRLG